jgi:competence protein ComEC
MTYSKALFGFCLAFTVGIAIASVLKIPQILIWGILFLGFAFIFNPIFLFRSIPSKPWSLSVIIGFFVLFLVIGILRFQIAYFNFENNKLRMLNDNPEKIILFGQIIDDPDVKNKFQKLKVEANQIIFSEKEAQTDSFDQSKTNNVEGIVLVTTGHHPEYSYLDKVKITGKLKAPISIGDFNYQNYLMKDGIYSIMDFPKIELVSGQHNYNFLSFFYQKILFAKEKLKESVNKNFPSPQNSMIEGIVFGDDKNMPKDLKDKFNSGGLSHITAVSGSNIVILINLLMPLLLILGFWRGQAFYIIIIFIWFYITLVGLPASGIRAAIMGSAFLLAEKLGRQGAGSRIILLAAVIMLMANPLLLRHDIGFQLSFMASMGIIYLKPIVDNFVKINGDHPNRPKAKFFSYEKLNYLSDIVSTTISAQIFVLPIIIYNFGNISLVAIITNLFILPTITMLMIFGFGSALFGIFSNFLGWVFYLPCWIFLTYILKVLDIFHQPWSIAVIKNVSWIWVFSYYLTLVALIWWLNKKLKPKFLGY